MSLPWDILILLAREYFHPREALIALRLCRRMNAVLQPDKARFIRNLLIYNYKQRQVAELERSLYIQCELCGFDIPKTTMTKHMMKHEKGKRMPILRMDTCDNCGTKHRLNTPHDCPCTMYDCRDSRYSEEFPWAGDICTECPMYKKRWYYIKHNIYVECLYCHEKFKVQSYKKDWRDTGKYIRHLEACPFKDQIITDHGELVTPDNSED